ncbi:MAG: hypothetical protein LBM93_00100 [Oscillospiraceae bacterium]|jgi:hypothetical protein|nr:hypothetical protein [Oscillospiraceae bacterium]
MKKFLCIFCILTALTIAVLYFFVNKDEKIFKKKITFTYKDYSITLTEDFTERENDKRYQDFIKDHKTAEIFDDFIWGTTRAVYPEMYVVVRDSLKSATHFVNATGDGYGFEEREGKNYDYIFWNSDGYDVLFTRHIYKKYYYTTYFIAKEDTVKNAEKTYLKYADTIKFPE